jgi:hypothetical protein
MTVCTRCGREVPQGAAFCPNCGKPKTSETDAASQTETILFAIEGFRGVSRHMLIFTDHRLIIAPISVGAKRLASLATLGLAELAHEEIKAKKLTGDEFEKVLSDKQTYTISNNEIKEIEVYKGMMLLNGSITINKTSGESEKFRVNIKKRMNDFEKSMKSLFGEQLIVKR